MVNAKAWKEKRMNNPGELSLAKEVLEDLRCGMDLRKALRQHPLPDGAGFLAKHTLVAAYRELVESGEWEEDPQILAAIRMKPIRTLSGVTTITVLTKPNTCPGECIFCPTESNMPQSYLSDEPGARRGVENEFDPYRQVASRLKALHEVGHPTDKVELLVLGGSWTAYPPSYREWFIRRCFEALNTENPLDNQGEIRLEDVQTRNETSQHRNVGLVVETRPDLISRQELIFNRKLGVTKFQIGIQSLDDGILERNKRGHTSEQARQAVDLLRAAGFKVVAHWMPNLLGATLESDRADFAKLWIEGSIQPDELKIYPCQLLQNTELYHYWQKGEYQPYSEEQLIDLLADIKPTVPRYCRINRVIRDIPSTNVVAGNRNTSLRQDVARELERRGKRCNCIRCREIRGSTLQKANLELHDLVYQTGVSEEHFLAYDTEDNRLAGFLRLSLPYENNVLELPDLEDAAIIREVHVYGQSLEVGTEQAGAAQHAGIGKNLIQKAEEIARGQGYNRLAVIAAVGTRQYYAMRGFGMGELYMVKPL